MAAALPTPEQNDELKNITEGIVKWATEFYGEELENEAKRTGIPFTPIVSPLNESIPVRIAEKRLLAWRNAYAERKVVEADRKSEKEMLALIEERDSLESRLDSLAESVAAYFKQDIGEHSSMNDPWYNAFQLLRDNTTLSPKPEEEI